MPKQRTGAIVGRMNRMYAETRTWPEYLRSRLRVRTMSLREKNPERGYDWAQYKAYKSFKRELDRALNAI